MHVNNKSITFNKKVKKVVKKRGRPELGNKASVLYLPPTRVTAAQKKKFLDDVKKSGLSKSDYVRVKLGLKTEGGDE